LNNINNDETFIHEYAHVSPTAKIGKGSKIWINAQIREDSIIGRNCTISKDVYIDLNVHIGNNCKIQNGVSIFCGVHLEDDVFVGPNACFTNDKIPRAFSTDWEIFSTKVCKGASIGANSTILCGLTVGEYSMIGAGSVVTKDVPPYTLVLGSPARIISKIDKYGKKVN
tara:strand:+ start:2234 stop:2740 length:507 start_codon:yes stop_codon:yes gene_type:complete